MKRKIGSVAEKGTRKRRKEEEEKEREEREARERAERGEKKREKLGMRGVRLKKWRRDKSKGNGMRMEELYLGEI